MWTSAPSSAPGRSRAYGPTSAPFADLHAERLALDVGERVDHRAGRDPRIRDHAVGADAHALAQLDAALEHAVDVDLDVLGAHQFAAQVEARRVRPAARPAASGASAWRSW
jgi:hypothetical protein